MAEYWNNRICHKTHLMPFFSRASQRRADPRNVFLANYTSLQAVYDSWSRIYEGERSQRCSFYPVRVLDLGLSTRRLIFQRSIGQPADYAIRVEIQDAIEEFHSSVGLMITFQNAQPFNWKAAFEVTIEECLPTSALIFGIGITMMAIGFRLRQLGI